MDLQAICLGFALAIPLVAICYSLGRHDGRRETIDQFAAVVEGHDLVDAEGRRTSSSVSIVASIPASDGSAPRDRRAEIMSLLARTAGDDASTTPRDQA
jgi:hypothetical protein